MLINYQSLLNIVIDVYFVLNIINHHWALGEGDGVLVTINHHYVITINHSSPLIWVNYNDLTATELWNHGLF